eukprot:CAMPEP_0180333010 /NCGR_PEP_ID=MMETSP0988-20121125/42844_1 /TAXON_ID=697907 /ORGANISM="non described non described, Strain CCMP2293" /LENGTH=104 /DNA_ID=CAMNT_0022320707 /DNA_START=33 /DNA_END=344 /DNA_ORIENTATION=-
MSDNSGSMPTCYGDYVLLKGMVFLDKDGQKDAREGLMTADGLASDTIHLRRTEGDHKDLSEAAMAIDRVADETFKHVWEIVPMLRYSAQKELREHQKLTSSFSI